MLTPTTQKTHEEKLRLPRLGWRALVVAVAVLLVAGSTAIAAEPLDEGDTHVIDDGVIDTPLEADQLRDGSGAGVQVQRAGPGQHPGPGGHLPGSSEDVELVGQLTLSNVEEGQISDVGALGDFAYLGSFATPNCDKGGFYVVDISDPTNPTEVGFFPTAPGSYVGEGVQAIPIKTKAFKGDILVINNEICALTDEQIGGFSLFDVTDPRHPVPLVEGFGDTDPGGAFSAANQIHSAFAWQQGKRAFVVVVDDEELADVDIFEITDPRNPVQIAEVGLEDWPGAQNAQSDGTGAFAASFLHDMVVKKVRGDWLMLASYWDAGYITLNVNDPANPVFLNDTDFLDPDPLSGVSPAEGNAHQAEFNSNSRFILAADEDFSPFRVDTFTIATGPNAGTYPGSAVGGAASPTTLPDGELNGPIVYGGYGCPDSVAIPPRATAGLPPLAPGEEAIVVLQRGPTNDPSAPEAACFPGEKAANAIAAGYDAVVFVNRHISDPEPVPFCGSGGFPSDPPIVAVCTTHEAFHLMFGTTPDFSLPYDPEPNTEPDIGSLGEYVEATGTFDGWGYVHLYDARTLQEIDQYAIPEGLDPAFAEGFGDLSVHEVATDPKENLAYISYYAGGFRVVKFGSSGIEEVGHYIDQDGNNFWGVQIVESRLSDKHRGKDDQLVLASDRDSGLWIFRYTGN